MLEILRPELPSEWKLAEAKWTYKLKRSFTEAQVPRLWYITTFRVSRKVEICAHTSMRVAFILISFRITGVVWSQGLHFGIYEAIFQVAPGDF